MPRKLQFELLQDWNTPDLSIKKSSILELICEWTDPDNGQTHYHWRAIDGSGSFTEAGLHRMRSKTDWFREIKPEAAKVEAIDLINCTGKDSAIGNRPSRDVIANTHALFIAGWKSGLDKLRDVVNKALEAYAEENC